MLELFALIFTGAWIGVSGDVNLCLVKEGNFSLSSNRQSAKPQLFKLQDDNCASHSNVLVLKLHNVHCADTTSLLIKEFPIEKDICKHGSGRCFIFTEASAEDGLVKGLPLTGCKHLHWLHKMSKITVRLSLTYSTSNSDGVDLSYHFIRQRHIVQGDDGEIPKPNTKKMDVLLLVLVILVVILAVATVIVTARMCYVSKKYHGMEKLSDYPADNTAANDDNGTSNLGNGGGLLQTEREVIPNRLYDGARHVYEDARF